jgi:hypothetical protein
MASNLHGNMLFLFYFMFLVHYTFFFYSGLKASNLHGIFSKVAPQSKFREKVTVYWLWRICPGKPAAHVGGGGGGKEGGGLLPVAVDASVMNLSHAAVRQLSCPPEEAQASQRPTGTGIGATGANAAQDSSVIGMSRSAMREVSVPREERHSNKFSNVTKTKKIRLYIVNMPGH